MWFKKKPVEPQLQDLREAYGHGEKQPSEYREYIICYGGPPRSWMLTQEIIECVRIGYAQPYIIGKDKWVEITQSLTEVQPSRQ